MTRGGPLLVSVVGRVVVTVLPRFHLSSLFGVAVLAGLGCAKDAPVGVQVMAEPSRGHCFPAGKGSPKASSQKFRYVTEMTHGSCWQGSCYMWSQTSSQEPHSDPVAQPAIFLPPPLRSPSVRAQLTSLVIAAAFALAACSGSGSSYIPPDADPLAPDAGPAAFLEACDLSNDTCVDDMVCFNFNSRGPHCTHECTASAECAEPSPGCNGKGMCKAP